MEQSVTEIGTVEKEQEANVIEHRRLLRQAELGLDDAIKAGNVPEAALRSYENLVMQTQEAAKKEEAVLDKTRHYKSMLKEELSFASKEMMVLDEELNALIASSEQGEAMILDFGAGLQKVETAAKNLAAANLTQLIALIRSVREQTQKASEEYIKINKTLALTKEFVGEEKQTIVREKARMDKVRQALTEAEARQDGEQSEFREAKEALKQAAGKELALRKKFEALSATLDQGVQANKAALRKLQHSVPEIVRQHNLVLLDCLSSW
uniref:Uncharacterized protein n=1 Tax=Alexandrium andersonii TaxID=327968 RepID=A0A7S2MXM9_9DINO